METEKTNYTYERLIERLGKVYPDGCAFRATGVNVEGLPKYSANPYKYRPDPSKEDVLEYNSERTNFCVCNKKITKNCQIICPSGIKLFIGNCCIRHFDLYGYTINNSALCSIRRHLKDEGALTVNDDAIDLAIKNNIISKEDGIFLKLLGRKNTVGWNPKIQTYLVSSDFKKREELVARIILSYTDPEQAEEDRAIEIEVERMRLEEEAEDRAREVEEKRIREAEIAKEAEERNRKILVYGKWKSRKFVSDSEYDRLMDIITNRQRPKNYYLVEELLITDVSENQRVFLLGIQEKQHLSERQQIWLDALSKKITVKTNEEFRNSINLRIKKHNERILAKKML